MRFALLAAVATLTVSAPAFAKNKPQPVASRQVMEKQVNARLDKQLHAALRKLLDAPAPVRTAEASVVAPVSLFSAR
jgi:hypothetical protein